MVEEMDGGGWDLLNANCDLAVVHRVVDVGSMSSSIAIWARDWIRRRVFSSPAVVRVKLENWWIRLCFGFGGVVCWTVIFLIFRFSFSFSPCFSLLIWVFGLYCEGNWGVRYGVSGGRYRCRGMMN
jgi:hypothetical protein